MGLMGENLTQIVIPVAALVGIVFALFQWFLVSKVRVIGFGLDGYKDRLIEEDEPEEGIDSEEAVAKCAEIQNAISVGNLCKPALANAIFTTIAFLLGALTSVLSGFLGMKIATYANARTTLEATKGVETAFITAFRSGAVMGFLLAANGLLVLYVSVNLFKLYYGDDWEGLYESITGYGLGGSSMALFGRVGGGIYTKAADVGADLVGKVERNISEDDPRNPADKMKIFMAKYYCVRLHALFGAALATGLNGRCTCGQLVDVLDCWWEFCLAGGALQHNRDTKSSPNCSSKGPSAGASTVSGDSAGDLESLTRTLYLYRECAYQFASLGHQAQGH
ncbi:hypothetical protein HYC85_003299 [Camellia sinensis]|uniref:H(+)-exporting diphosphatase n=1 Tax=Camellia sinensis TaxID=4442 RepID=A0A7J7IAX3_CAMSI|nr:hypothetical protein HYC85_003299 [Camellia sinensis]